MAAPLKEILGPETVDWLASNIKRAWPRFDDHAFRQHCLDGLASLELSPRAAHIATALERHLPTSFERAADILIRSLGDHAPASGSSGMSVLRYMPHVHFVRTYGLDDFDASMTLQRELTQRFSAEWSIRAFLVRYPERTYAQLEQWAADPNVHLRRLVSEGTRPRLPWAERLRNFQADPQPVIALLERLKDDPERYVQRSVANNLNDIAKDHPEIALAVCRRWLENPTASRRWIVRHALRSLVKQGNAAALALLGSGTPPRVRLARIRLAPPSIRIGETVRCHFDLVSEGDVRQVLTVDYVVHYVKASGNTSAKVFKLRRLELEAGQTETLELRVNCTQRTTRKHYPGDHRIDLQINGTAFPLKQFRLTAE